MSRPARLRVVAALGCALLTVAVGPWGGAVAGAATTIALSGHVYWDQNNDGIHDASEPGVPGIRVHLNSGAGTPTTVTGADGQYTLAGLPSGGTGTVVIETGWFRSQCAVLSCAAGPGPDNDFKTTNQFVQFAMAGATHDVANLDAGLLPDWPGNSSVGVVQGGRVPANVVDVATRLSWVTSTCSDGKYFICRPGDTYTVTSQFLNQGTTPITGLRAVLALPAGDHLASGNPGSDVVLNSAATSPGVTGLTVGAPSASAVLSLTFAGTLVPGGLIKVTGKFVAGGTVGTPGCLRGAPTTQCPTGEPFGAPLMLGVTHIDQSGDPDSFGPGCDALIDVRRCPTGIHDKQVEPDDIDPVGHNVDVSAGTNLTYNLTSSIDVLAPPPPTWVPGSALTWRASAFNVGPALAGSGWMVTVLLPKNSNPGTPSANALRTCTQGTSTAGYPYVRCTGRGPLSPGVTSIAIDVTAVIPAGTVAGTQLSAVAYVQPAAAQGTETNPLGAAPLSPLVDTGASATDNDASTQFVLP